MADLSDDNWRMQKVMLVEARSRKKSANRLLHDKIMAGLPKGGGDPATKPGPLKGLEGPFWMRTRKGWQGWLYYDPKEGQYYDRGKDMYLDKGTLFEDADEAQLKKASGKLYGATQGLKEALAAAKGTPFEGEISGLMSKVQAVKAEVDGAENRAWASSQHESSDESEVARAARLIRGFYAGDEGTKNKARRWRTAVDKYRNEVGKQEVINVLDTIGSSPSSELELRALQRFG